MKVSVAGAGAWGTTIADILAEKCKLNLWCFEKELSEIINKKNENTMYLPGIKLNKNIMATSDLKVLNNSDLIVMAVPSMHFDQMVNSLKDNNINCSSFLILTKGFDLKRKRFLSDILSDKFPKSDVYALSGPNLAAEIILRKPGSAVIAGKDLNNIKKIQDLFIRDYFRVYTSDDIKGVQIGGAFKNILAIGAGISDSLGFGINTKAAYLTRGIMEMSRFGTDMGAKPYTFMGLSGIGDLIATANSKLSRNYSYGYSIINQKQSPYEVFKNSSKAIEGVLASKAVYEIAMDNNIEVPITESVYNIIFNGHNIKECVQDLMTRDPKNEIY